jgi:hypothetical protein
MLRNRNQSKLVTLIAKIVIIAAIIYVLIMAMLVVSVPAQKDRQIALAMEWAQLDPVPEQADSESIESQVGGNLFKRTITVTFIAPLDVIDAWLAKSPGTANAKPTEADPLRTYKTGMKQGATIWVDPATGKVTVEARSG